MSNSIFNSTQIKKENILLPFYALVHPIDAFETMKYKKNGSYRVSIVILFIWILSEVFVRKNKGFIFNLINPDMVNIFDIISGTLAIFLMIVISNFLLCIFMDGEGTFKQIFSCFNYVTLIIIFYNIGTILLTNILSIEMTSFFILYTIVFYVWGVIYVLCGVMTVHQFTLKKTVINIAFTILGAALIASLLFLLYSLFQQVASFFYTIYNEILFRL